MITKEIITVLILAILSLEISASCWSSAFYHKSADLMEKGIGNISSDAVCIYGNSPKLDDECNAPCQLLLQTTWGDCYCRYPEYKPGLVSDPLLTPLSVQELYEMLSGKSSLVLHANCRSWLNQPSHQKMWQCES
eukprot:TRINITY_DN3929_c0_g1_i1.p1 TRINITY_DN3929_c0_g1~~TRINITY_DN3929_c0_g1_i1.p1  ORF type:complete len:135 (-),score=14.27 TRINITY_DN3929_c0_g1_i1:99-503(-)